MDSREYKTMRQFYPQLITCVKQSPNDIADHLVPVGILAPRDLELLSNPQISSDDKARRIVSVVMNHVENGSQEFHKFVSVLEAAGTWTKKTVSKLKAFLQSSESDHVLGSQMMALDDHFCTKSATCVNQKTDSETECHKAAFVCPYCGECTMEQFFSEGCPKQVQLSTTKKKEILFPHLNVHSLHKEDMIDLEKRLTNETREIKTCFGKFQSNVIKSLEDLHIPIDMFKASILSLYPFTDNIGVKELDKEDEVKIEAARTISEVFITLRKYISFFNYHIVEYIIDLYGAETDHILLEKYVEKFHNFCKRNVFEVPQNAFASNSRETAKVFAIKCTEGVSTMQGVERVTGDIAEIFGLRPSAFYLYSIKKGCVELHFLISADVANYIFPVSHSQHSALKELGIKVLPMYSTSRVAIQSHEEALCCLLRDVDFHSDKEKSLAIKCVSASQRGSVSEVSSLIEQGANVNKYGVIALFAACEGGKHEVVKILLQSGVHPNIQNTAGCTALMIASYHGHVRCVELLITAGAAVDVQDKNEWTALLFACANGHDEAVNILIQKGADLNIQNNAGGTALFIASHHGHVRCVELLTTAGTAVDVQDKAGGTALFIASYHGHVRCVELLITAGATVDVQDKNEWTALLFACANGHDEAVNILIQKGADLNIQNNAGCTALFIASYHGHVRCVELLITAGAAVDVQNKAGETALFIASYHGHVRCVELLITAGAAVDVQDKVTNASESTPLVRDRIFHLASV